MPTSPAASQRAVIAAARKVVERIHKERTNGIGAGRCVACGQKWPCDIHALALALDALDDA